MTSLESARKERYIDIGINRILNKTHGAVAKPMIGPADMEAVDLLIVMAIEHRTSTAIMDDIPVFIFGPTFAALRLAGRRSIWDDPM